MTCAAVVVPSMVTGLVVESSIRPIASAYCHPLVMSSVGVVQDSALIANGIMLSVPGDGGGSGDDTVTLPAAWTGMVLPATHIAPLCAQIALHRGDVWSWSGVDGSLTIGGRVLVGSLGSQFCFTRESAAANWISINKQRVASEYAMYLTLSRESRAEFVAGKMRLGDERATRLVDVAAITIDAGIREALIAESSLYLDKWRL